ncbi:hypothetical protein WA026_011572 [Henosepilachna vigintioctopunctata]|uniref:Uncharacterized protein n=1 Tax=Henosepilachna vigintioctopunctata TaxID=420089 RepID=A0AAW1TVW7_9CUCU
MASKNEEKDLKQRTSVYEKLWLMRSTLEKRLIFIAVIFVVLLIITVLVYSVFLRKPEICTSSACLETSMNLLNQIDVKLNPCHDFYKFSCGNFLKNTNLERERFRSAPDIMREEIQSKIKNMLEHPVDATQPRYLKLAKEFYRSCMNESSIEAEGLKWMKQIFKRLGGWPTLEGDDWQEEDFDWKKAVHKLRQMGLNFEFFIRLSVERDKKEPAKYILQLSDPYKSHRQPIAQDIKRIYLRYMENVAVHFGANLVDARIEQQDVLEFTLELARMSEESRRSNMSDLYNPYVLSELQFEFSSINWFEYISAILSPSVKLNYDEQILVPDPLYLRKLENLLLNTSKRVLANFMAWHTLQYYILFLPSELVNKAYEYMETINGNISRKPRWEMCVNTVKERMGPAVSSSFIEQYFDEETRQDVSEMMHNIKAQYKNTLESFEWIDEATRRMTKEKLLDSAVDIVSYSDVNSLSQLASSFNDVKIYHDNLLLSVVNLDQFALDGIFRKLRRPADRTNWLEDPDFVTGLDIVFSPDDDILVFPIGILGGLYYAKDRPKYSNYGALGTTIAQKLWQIITSTEYKGRIGEAKNWWSSSTLLNYEDRLKCLGNVFEGNIASRDYVS